MTVTVNCPCGLYGQNYTPSVTSRERPDAAGTRRQVHLQRQRLGRRRPLLQGRWQQRDAHRHACGRSTGTQLATGTFTNETASGWQTLLFANPVQITANTVYVASYYDPDGHYAATPTSSTRPPRGARTCSRSTARRCPRCRRTATSRQRRLQRGRPWLPDVDLPGHRLRRRRHLRHDTAGWARRRR